MDIILLVVFAFVGGWKTNEGVNESQSRKLSRHNQAILPHE